eukprot:3131109-Heterocapsa_arctica.AAC.1
MCSWAVDILDQVRGVPKAPSPRSCRVATPPGRYRPRHLSPACRPLGKRGHSKAVALAVAVDRVRAYHSSVSRRRPALERVFERRRHALYKATCHSPRSRKTAKTRHGG